MYSTEMLNALMGLHNLGRENHVNTCIHDGNYCHILM